MESDNVKQSPLEALMDLGKMRLTELKELADDLFTYMSPLDVATLLFPPALGLSMADGILSGRAFQDDGFGPDCPEEALYQSALNMARWWSKHYFTTQIHNVEKLPAQSPVLIAGNHSAGLMPLDALFAIDKIRQIHGSQQRVYSMVHDFAYMSARVGKVAKRMGVLRAKKENALAALASGGHVLTYPGGDQDAFRTYKDRGKIVLANRKGFVRLAMTAGVPIVPLVSVGLHESFLVLSRGEKVAQKLKLKEKLRTDILPMSLSFPWGLVPAFFPFIPLPTAIEMEFCNPVDTSGSAEDDARVNEIYTQIETEMQKTMDRLSKNRTPLFGR